MPAIILYSFRHLILALALGVAFARAKSCFSACKEHCRFLIGMCATPLFVALFDYVLGLVWPGAPKVLFVALPPLLAVCYLLLHGNYRVVLNLACAGWKTLRILLRAAFSREYAGFTIAGLLAAAACCCLLSRTNQFPASLLSKTIGPIPLWFFAGIVAGAGLLALSRIFLRDGRGAESARKGLIGIGVLLFITVLLFCNGEAAKRAFQQKLYESDRSHYEMQARFFAEDRDSREIDHYSGADDGTVLRDDHGPLWPAFIGDARMMASADDDFLNPRTIDATYILLYFSFLLLLGVTACSICGSPISALMAYALYFLYRYAAWFMPFGSRDAFRFIGLLLFLLLLYDFSMRLFARDAIAEEKGARYGARDYAAALLFSFLSIQGHQGNVYLMLGASIVFFGMLLIGRASFKHMLPLAAGILLGTALGMLKTVFIYLDTGLLSSSTKVVFEGTPVMEQLAGISKARSDWGVIFASYLPSDRLMAGIGAAGMLFGLFLGIRLLLRRGKGSPEEHDLFERRYAIFAGLSIGMLLYLTGIFDFLGYKASLAFVEQTRYRMCMFVLFAINGGLLTAYLFRISKRLWVRCMLTIATAAVLAVSASVSNSNRVSWDSVTYVNQVADFYQTSADTVSSRFEGKNTFVSEQVLLYYFKDPAKLMYHPYAGAIMQAKTNEEIVSALRGLEAKVFVFDERIYHDYSLLPFYAYLQDERNAEHLHYDGPEGSNTYVDVYIVR